MVKIGIITDSDVNSFLPDISIVLYESLNKHKCFSPHIISRDKKRVVNNVIIKDLEEFLSTAYADNFTVFFNLTKRELFMENLTFFNIVEYSNVDFLTLVFKKNASSKRFQISIRNPKSDFGNFQELNSVKDSSVSKHNIIFSSEEIFREALSSDSNVSIVECDKNTYIFKNDKVGEIQTKTKSVCSNKLKYQINVNIFANWCDSKSLMPDIKKYSRESVGENNFWNFKNRKINITHGLAKADYNYVMNGTNESLSTNTIYTCLEPPNNSFFEYYYTNSRKANVTYFGSHLYHPNFVGWHLSLSINDLIKSLEKPFVKLYDKVLSVVVSDFYRDEGHKLRIDFIRELDNRSKNKTLPFDLHIYGRCKSLGFHSYKCELPSAVKDNGLVPYKYHFNAENTCVKNYVTEKFTDAIMSECLLFYWGCPNIKEIYDPDSFVVLTLEKKNYDKEIEMLSNMINNDEYGKRRKNILDVKRDMLENRNLFVKINNIISLSDTNVYVLNNKLSSTDVELIKNSCFKVVQGLSVTDDVGKSEVILNILSHMIGQEKDAVMINDFSVQCGSLYGKLSNVCLDNYDIVFINYRENDSLLKSNFWSRIDVIEEIFAYVFQMYNVSKNVNVDALIQQMLKKYKIKNIK
jgi:hypothetical protein